MGLFAALLCLAGFRIQGDFAHFQWQQMVLCTLLSFATCSLAMLWNDYVDRERDLLKGKRLAFDNPERFYRILHRLGIGIGFSAGFVKDYRMFGTSVTLIAIILAIFYSNSYKRPLLPMLMVGTCSAYPSLYGLMAYPKHVWAGLGLFLVVFSAIAAREVLKDIEDERDDVGYKLTLPVLVGAGISSRIAATLYWISAGLVLATWPLVVPRACSVLIAVCGLVIWPINQPKIAKLSLDLTIIAFLSGILLGRFEP